MDPYYKIRINLGSKSSIFPWSEQKTIYSGFFAGVKNLLRSEFCLVTSARSSGQYPLKNLPPKSPDFEKVEKNPPSYGRFPNELIWYDEIHQGTHINSYIEFWSEFRHL